MDDKQLILERLPHGQLYKIRFNQGGSVPQELSGLYNKRTVALKAIEEYEKKKATPKREYRKSGTAEERRKAKKVKEDDESKSKSGSK